MVRKREIQTVDKWLNKHSNQLNICSWWEYTGLINCLFSDRLNLFMKSDSKTAVSCFRRHFFKIMRCDEFFAACLADSDTVWYTRSSGKVLLYALLQCSVRISDILLDVWITQTVKTIHDIGRQLLWVTIF